MTYQDEKGDIITIDVKTAVKAHETLTVLGYNVTTGMLTYKDEKGDSTIVDVKGAVKSFETLTNLTSSTTTGTLTYKDEKGVDTVINMGPIIKAQETLTVLAYNAPTGALTYKDEYGITTTVDLKAVVKAYESLTVLAYDTTTGALTYKDETGVTTTVNVKTAIKVNETVTRLVNNNDGTLTYYNEREIDATGEPMANTGTTFNIPTTKTYELTNVITAANSQTFPSDWTLEQMTKSWNYPDHFANTDEESKLIFSSYFNTDGNNNGSKYMNFDFFVKSNTHTMGNANPIGKLEAELEVNIYINGILIKEFFSLRYTFGRGEGYDRFDIKHYGGILTYGNNLNLTATNNQLEIRIAPVRSTFKNNIGTSNGSFVAGTKAFSIEVLDAAFHIFEKQ